jgi:integrase
MDNFDLFQDYNQTTHIETPVETKVETTPAPTTDADISTDPNRCNILVFAHKYSRDMWLAFKHRRDCLMQVRRFAEFRDFGVKPMASVTAEDVIAYRSYLKAETDLNPGTINRHLSAVSACFRFAVEELQVMKDRPRVSLLKEEEPNTRAFTRDQVQRMIELHQANGDYWVADMIRLGCLTGMRQSEITALNLDVIDWNHDSQEAYLPPSVTKSKKGRWVNLQAEGAWDVAQRLRGCIGREFTHRRFYDRWNDVKDMMGHRNDNWFKFHATRHYAATSMARAKVNSLTVAEQLGHSSLSTTRKYYHGDAEARGKATSVIRI